MPYDSAHASTAPSAAQVITLIDTWDDLPSKRRRTLKSAVRVLETVTCRPAEQISMAPQALNRALRTATAAAAGLQNESSFTTYKNSLRYVLRRSGLLPSGRRELSPAWKALGDALVDDYRQSRLPGFLAFASAQGLTPEQVDDRTVAAYAEHLRAGVLRRKPDQHVRKVVALWNTAVDTVPGWPQRRLAAPVKTVRFTPPFTAYPESFQAEVRSFEDRLSGKHRKGLFAGNGPRNALSAGTVKSRIYNIRQAGAALVMQGRDPASITSLADLVEQAAFESILDFYFLRAGEQKTTQLSAIASALLMVGRYHCRLSPERIESLAAFARDARPPKQTEMNDKNIERLRRLEDPYKEAQLLCLSTELMLEAQALRAGVKRQEAHAPDGRSRTLPPKPKPREAVWAAATAVAVQILLICPMRAENLAELRLDTSLARLGRKSRRITHLLVPRADVKNGKRIEWPIPAEMADFIQVYLDEFRPLLPHHGAAWLFPHRDNADQHRDKVAMSQAISHAIRKHVGIEMHVHLFRGYAAKTIMEENSGALDDLRLLLGHKGLEMSIRHYLYFRGKEVASRFNSIVFEKQRKAHVLVAARLFNPMPHRLV